MSAYPQHNTTGQRQHTNPRARLRAWKAPESEGQVWCYSKQPRPERRIYRQTIASATVLRGIWTEEEEERSNTEVEQPAAPGLACLTDSLQPTLRKHDRQAVARYMMSMFRRGWQELTAQPKRLRPEVAQLRTMIHTAGFSPEALHVLEAEIADLSECPPGRPLPIRRVADVMAAMRWTVLRCSDPMFVNGDSPVQIVPHVIINPESEVTLPLSPTRVLICDWGFPRPPITIRVATDAEVLEVNRRTAMGAEQYVYFADRPTDNAVREFLDGGPRRRILDDSDRRAVPRKHRRSMERDARRILSGRERENIELVEHLRNLEAADGLVVRDDDPAPQI